MSSPGFGNRNWGKQSENQREVLIICPESCFFVNTNAIQTQYGQMNEMLNTSGIPTTSATSTVGDSVSYSFYADANTQYVAMKKDEDVYFTGHSNLPTLQSWLDGSIPRRFIELVTNAINNRTRERNFSRLNEQLASGDISEEDFDKAISEREDEFVIQCNIKPTEWDIKAASLLAENLLDVSDTDDLSVLFSFDDNEVRKYILK